MILKISKKYVRSISWVFYAEIIRKVFLDCIDYNDFQKYLCTYMFFMEIGFYPLIATNIFFPFWCHLKNCLL